MTTTLIITLCVLILLAYAFDLSSKFTKIPTVVFLLVLGWLMQQLAFFFKISLPPLKPLLPILGTIGLILIVLEGSLELELNGTKKAILTKTTLSALIPMLVLIVVFGFGFQYFSGKGLMASFINAIPICVISSAIAIPSVQNLSREKKEFIIYESSLSDILGVVIFNFFVANEVISLLGIGNFLIEIVAILIISLLSSLGLAFLIKKISHHVKFIPIIVMIILIYALSKVYHLPALIFILIFGLLLNNLDELKMFSIIRKLEPEKLNEEVHRFREVVVEMAFLVRTLFFLLFGFLINSNEILNIESFFIALAIVSAILLVRLIYFKIAKIPLNPLLFVSPRGLITILLFLSIPASKKISFVNETLMIQIIIISALVMMLGLMANKKPGTGNT